MSKGIFIKKTTKVVRKTECTLEITGDGIRDLLKNGGIEVPTTARVTIEDNYGESDLDHENPVMISWRTEEEVDSLHQEEDLVLRAPIDPKAQRERLGWRPLSEEERAEQLARNLHIEKKEPQKP